MPKAETVEIRWAEPGDCTAIAGLERLVKLHYGEEPEPLADIESAVARWLEAKPGHALFAMRSSATRRPVSPASP